MSYPDQIDEKKRELNEKLDVLNKKKHDLVQMLKQVLFPCPCFSWSMSLVVVFPCLLVQYVPIDLQIVHKFMISDNQFGKI